MSDFPKAVFALTLSIFLFDVQGAIIKYMGDAYPVQQLAMFRNIFGLIPSILVLYLSSVWHSDGRPVFIKRWRLGILRGLFVAIAQFCFYYALVTMEFATATTLVFAGPLFITMLSIPVLKLKVDRYRWLAVAIGFTGVLLIMRPGTDLFTPYALLPVGAAFFYALSSVSARLFDENIPTAILNIYASFGALLGSCVFLITTSEYVHVDAKSWLGLIAMGVAGGFAVLLMTTAYRLTQPGSLSPFEYFGIPFSYFIGWIFFAETPFAQLFPGVLFIIGGGLLIVWREHLSARSKSLLTHSN